MLLDTDHVDTVLFTYTLCTIPDVRSALREAQRVFKSDGSNRCFAVCRGRGPRRWKA